MKKRVWSGVLAGAVVALLGAAAPRVAAQGAPLWTVFVHLEYADGTSYDVPMQRGVPMSDVVTVLQDCGRSHRTGSVVRYHCYPVPE